MQFFQFALNALPVGNSHKTTQTTSLESILDYRTNRLCDFELTLYAGYFFLFLLSAVFFSLKMNVLKKNISGIPLEC